jgi:L-lactate dehydrogenase complex protein LldG
VSARDAILAAVRAARPAGPPLPDVRAAAAAFVPPAGDLVERFAAASRAGGAEVIEGARADVERLAAEGASAHDGALGVAENGAVWVAPADGEARVALFLSERVVLAVPRAAIVADMHAAYARLDVAGAPFGVFVAGPSKTADIEQSLVIGAHGPKALTVVILSAAKDLASAAKDLAGAAKDLAGEAADPS